MVLSAWSVCGGTLMICSQKATYGQLNGPNGSTNYTKSQHRNSRDFLSMLICVQIILRVDKRYEELNVVCQRSSYVIIVKV